MLPSVRAFLSGIIDYAGLFPPAKLPLDRAVANYAKYRASSDAWMLGRFVIPAARLAELEPILSQVAMRAPITLSVLGRGGETGEAFRSGLVADLEAINTLRQDAAAAIDAYEVKLATSVLLTLAAEGLQWPDGMSVFCEVSPADVTSSPPAVADIGAGVKLRCGGLAASDFPEPDQVARVITACRDNRLPLKFTAGLHYPIRRFDRGLQTKMHGFINVFGASILAGARHLAEDRIRAILEDEDPSNFGFDEIGFGWKDHHVLIDEIIAARREFVVSFGSCSFDEPREDLREMGLLI
jgi:hypothetical protein